MSDLPYKIAMIVGVPRSGTTFLQIVLGAHPDVATGRETHLFDRYLGPLLHRYLAEEEDLKSADGIRHYIDRGALDRHFRSIALSVFAGLRAKSPHASVVIEKTPDHLIKLPMIAHCLPEAHIIHIVRDPRAVAASMKAAGHEDWGFWTDGNVARTAFRWRRGIDSADERVTRVMRYRQIRYEDLFVSGAAIVNELYAWLGLPPQDGMPDDLREKFPVDAMARVGGDVTDPRNETRARFFRRGDPDAWREELSSVEIATIEAICAERMVEFGYLPVARGLSRRLGRILAVLKAQEIEEELP